MRNDLSATALAELEAGSQQDHNARQERHTRMLEEAHEPVHWGYVLLLIVVLGLAAFTAGHMEPPNFNPFNR